MTDKWNLVDALMFLFQKDFPYILIEMKNINLPLDKMKDNCLALQGRR